MMTDQNGKRPEEFSQMEPPAGILPAGSIPGLSDCSLPLSRDQLAAYSPLAFAYIGDAVYDLIIRAAIVMRGNTRPNRYHQETICYVNAAAQTALMKAISPLLTEEEKKIFRRGLNAKPATTAKHQTRQDYRTATGLEALVGYLYLSGRTERILELVSAGFEQIS